MARVLLGWPAFLAIALTAQGWVVVAELRRDVELGRAVPGYLAGDSGLYAAATDSLLRDRDLDLLNQCFPGRPTLADALPALEGDRGSEYALSVDGRLILKQSPVVSVAALPFYAAFGLVGFQIFNLVVLNLLLIGLVKLAGDTPAARATILVGFLSTPLVWYSANFSPDLFLSALLVGSLLAARSGCPTLSGVLAGLAVSSKVYALALVLPVPVLVGLAAGERRWTALARLAAGGLLGLAPTLALNSWLFGAPWVMGYERQLLVQNGAVGLANHSSRFTVPLFDGLRNLLLDPATGLWPTAPLWFLWPVAAGVLLTPRLASDRDRVWPVVVAAVIGLNLAVFVPYDLWHATVQGNRFLFPALVLGLAMIGAGVGAVARAVPPLDLTASADRETYPDLAGHGVRS